MTKCPKITQLTVVLFDNSKNKRIKGVLELKGKIAFLMMSSEFIPFS